MMLSERVKLFGRFLYCRTFKKRIPIVAYLLITNRCQMRCSYCFVDHEYRVKELSTGKILNLIDELHEMGTRMICLMGGEPLIHEDIGVIVDYIKKKGMMCDVTTNALLIKDKIREIKSVDSLMISLDGNEEGNDRNRGEGTYKKIIEGIKIARKNGIITRINSVLTKHNYNNGSIEYLLDLCNKYDLFVTFSIMAESYEGHETVKDMLLSDREISQLYRKLKRLKNSGARLLFSNHTLDYIINYPLSYSEIIFKDDEKHVGYYSHSCPFGRYMCYIDSDGMVYPCATLWNVDFWKPKNYLEVGFKEAWDNMKDLNCQACFCASGPEWNHITSFSGLGHALWFSLSQILSKNRKVNL